MKIDLSLLKIEEIRDITKVKPGYYNFLMSDGTTIGGEVDGREVGSVQAKLRNYRASLESANQSATPAALSFSENSSVDAQLIVDDFDPDSIELKLDGSILDVELVDPNFQAFWCREDEVQQRINMMGYSHVRREEVRTLYCNTGSSKVGDSISSEGVIRVNELILLKVHKKIAAKISDHYRNRQHTPEGIEAEYVQRGGMTVNYPTGFRSSGIQTKPGIQMRKETTNG